MKFKLLLLILFFVAGCASQKDKLSLQVHSFSDIKHWNKDNHDHTLSVYIKNCHKFHKKDWQKFLSSIGKGAVEIDKSILLCDLAENYKNNHKSKEFFEDNFIPYLVKNNEKKEGLFTGYYELELKASLKKTKKYKYPIYAKPSDLGKRKPYYTRKEIDSGALRGKNLEIAYTDDNVRLFFLHIQGSGVLALNDGSKLRITYDGQNGHKYFSIGQYLYKNEKIAKQKINAEFIIKYLKTHPHKSQNIMEKNPSFVFFKINNNDSPVGARGVPLTHQRSIAIDRKFLPLGSLIWLETDHPINKSENFHRLMIAEDSGGAIKGPIRGDIYFGNGPVAEKNASYMQNAGSYFILLPSKLMGKILD